MTLSFSLPRILLALSCLCLGLLFPGLAAGQATTRTMTPAALADFRLYLDFSTSTYAGYPDRQDELRRGIDLGMRMWQSVLPGLQYQWVASASQANLQLKFDNYQNPANPIVVSCGAGTVFTACATAHKDGLLPPGAKIWFNDRGRSLAGSATPPFTFDAFTHVSRSQLLASYRPATLPPEGYSATNPGNYVGMYYAPIPAGSDDVSLIFFHEFAHVLGMTHYRLTNQQLIDWYGNPRSPSGAEPNQPYQRISAAQYPGLPSAYYDGYFGGGMYNPSTGQTTEAWTGDLDELHPVMYNHLHGQEDLDHARIPGIPLPPYASFNNRVVFPDDLGASMPPYAWSYPKINGLIVLEQPSTGYFFYTSDWSVAIGKAQLDRAGQPDRWFIKDVLTGNSLLQKLSAGQDHVLAIRSDGKVWAWGKNDWGQLGLGSTSTTPTTSPVPVTGLSGVFTSVAAGISHSVALRSDGTVWTWGRNSAGELGNNSTQPRSTPVQVCNLSGQTCSGNRYISIAAGGAHTLALRDDGTLWAWGYNGEGQAGQNHSAPVLLPRMEYWGANDWVSISAGSNHSLGLKADGPANAQGWGYAHRGQTGLDHLNNTYYPERVWSPQPWKQLALGGGASHFSLARNLDGALWAWGDNSFGQLGRNTTEFGHAATPVTVQGEGGARNWTHIGRGGRHAGGRKDDGTLWTWGDNTGGQLGRGSIASTGVPGQVSGNRTDWSSLFLGGNSSYAFRKDGSLWAWGSNQSGQLGNGSTTSSNTPVVSKFGDVPALRFYPEWTDHNSSVTRATPPGEVFLLRAQNAAGTGFTGTTFNLSASAYGNLPQVDFRNGTTLLGSDNSAPYGITWTAPSAGRYFLNARTVDRLNTAVTSPTLTVNVFQQGVRSRTPPTTSVDLHVEGALDWMHWGRSGTSRVEKASPSVAISMSAASFPVEPFSSTSTSVPGFSWSNGTGYNPTTVGQSRTGVKLTSGEAFQFKIPATTAVRTVQVWFRVRNAAFGTTTWWDHPSLSGMSISKAAPATISTSTQHLIWEMTFATATGTDFFNLQVYPNEFGTGGGEVVVQAIALK